MDGLEEIGFCARAQVTIPKRMRCVTHFVLYIHSAYLGCHVTLMERLLADGGSCRSHFAVSDLPNCGRVSHPSDLQAHGERVCLAAHSGSSSEVRNRAKPTPQFCRSEFRLTRIRYQCYLPAIFLLAIVRSC